MTRGEMVAAALPGWKGTPFHEQGRVKGKGCDCKGLLWGIAEELDFPEAQSEYARDIGYDLHRRGGVPSGRLKEGMAALFDPVREMRPGDVLLLRTGGVPGHLAVYSGNDRAYHTQIDGKAWVKETALRVLFHFYPLDSIWRWRD